MRHCRWLLAVFIAVIPTVCFCQEQPNTRGDDAGPGVSGNDGKPPQSSSGSQQVSAVGSQDWATVRRASMERACRLLSLDPNTVLVSSVTATTGTPTGTTQIVSQMDDRKSLEYRRERARKVARRLLEVAANPAAIATLANPAATPMQKVNVGLQLVGQLLVKDGAESATLNDPDRDELVQAKDLLTSGDEKQKAEFAEDLSAAIEVEKLVAERRVAIDRLKARQAKTVEVEEAKLEEYRATLHRDQLEKELEKLPQ